MATDFLLVKWHRKLRSKTAGSGRTERFSTLALLSNLKNPRMYGDFPFPSTWMLSSRSIDIPKHWRVLYGTSCNVLAIIIVSTQLTDCSLGGILTLYSSCPKGLLIRVPSKNDLLLHSVELCNNPITIDSLIVLLLKLLAIAMRRKLSLLVWE